MYPCMTTKIKLFYRSMILPGVVVHTCNPSTWEMQTGESVIILGNITSSSGILSQNKTKEGKTKPRSWLVGNMNHFISFQLGIIKGLMSFSTTSYLMKDKFSPKYNQKLNS